MGFQKKGGPVAWSTCEAEIMAASEAAKEAIHLRALYNELAQCEAKPTRVHLDCKAAIDTACNPEQQHSKLKHVHQRRHFFIRQVLVEDHQKLSYLTSKVKRTSRTSSPNPFPLVSSSNCVGLS